nr:hypothetical protein [Tanacetum cinerariifolium]
DSTDYSNARTPQQNGVAERKNRTLIEATRTSYLKPFGCHVTILNTSDLLGKFDKNSDEGYIVGYSISSKAYRVYNLVSRKIEETMNLKFLKNKPFVAGTGQAWMFDIDYLTDSLNYSRVRSTNLTAGSQGATPSNAGKEEADQLGLAFPSLNPILGVGSAPIGSSVSAGRPTGSAGRPVSAGRPTGSVGRLTGSAGRPVSTSKPTGSVGRPVSTGRPSGSAARTPVPAGRLLGNLTSNKSSELFPRASSVENSNIHDGLKIFNCLKSGIFTSSSYDEDFSGPDANNLESSLNVSSTITKRIHNIHPTSQRRNTHTDFQLCMFSCFFSQEEPTTVAQAFADPDWVEAMQAEM